MSKAPKLTFALTTTLPAHFIPSTLPVTRYRPRLLRKLSSPLRNRHVQTSYFSTSRTLFTGCVQSPSTSAPTPSVPAAQPDQSAAPHAHAQQQAQTVLDVLRERGLVDATTADDEVLRPLLSKPVSVYTGFDPTADSLHLGNLLAIVAMGWFQRMGHRVVAVVGGATGKVGDPSGKSHERPVLSDETIAANLRGIEANIRQVLERPVTLNSGAGGSSSSLVVMNNHDWAGTLSFLDFLRDVGKYARVNTMLAKDSVRTRLNSDDGISFTEFTYQLLQAYDFKHLYQEHGVTFQLGGSDQWGNITAGTELTRKLCDGATVHGITFPLLTTTDGRKFGKSEKGAVWLTADKLSPYEMYQFLYKTPDTDVITFLKRLTFLPLPQIADLERAMTSDGYQPNTAQKLLAAEVTRIVHGDDGVTAALNATAAAAPGSSAVLSADALEAIAKDMPSVTLPPADVVGRPVVDVMVVGGLQKSKGEARRLVKNGGAYVNNQKVGSASAVIDESDLIDGRLVLLAAGKKNKLVVRVD